MSLADRAKSGPASSPNRCGVSLVMNQMPTDNEEQAFREMLQDNRWSAPALTNALLEEGYKVNKRAVERHRRHECACPEEN